MLNQLATWLAVREDLHRLEMLDDRILADMGLERGDLRRRVLGRALADPVRPRPEGWARLARPRP